MPTAVAGDVILTSVEGLATVSPEAGTTVVFGLLLVPTAVAVRRASPVR